MCKRLCVCVCMCSGSRKRDLTRIWRSTTRGNEGLIVQTRPSREASRGQPVDPDQLREVTTLRTLRSTTFPWLGIQQPQLLTLPKLSIKNSKLKTAHNCSHCPPHLSLSVSLYLSPVTYHTWHPKVPHFYNTYTPRLSLNLDSGTVVELHLSNKNSCSLLDSTCMNSLL